MGQQLKNTPPFNAHLYDLLRSCLYGGVVRHHDRFAVDGVIVHRSRLIIDGTDANLAQTLGMSAIDAHQWLSWSEIGQPEQCWLNDAGNTVFDAWQAALWGPPTRPITSDRPLAVHSLGLSDDEIAEIRLGFADLDQHKDCP